MKEPPESDDRFRLIHEIQHVIQEIEGFAAGASPEYWRKNPVIKAEAREKVQAAKDRVAQVEEKFRKEWPNDEINLDLARQYVELSEQYFKDGNADLLDTMQRINEIENAAKETGFDDLLDEYDEARGLLSLAESEAKHKIVDPNKLYIRTAGEIEARDAASRRNMTQEQRLRIRPNVGSDGVVFAGDSTSGWLKASEYDPETASIKQQIENSQDVLNKMEPVASATVPTEFRTKEQAATWAIEILKSSGYAVDKQDFGKITFDEEDIKKAVNYADTDEEKAALAVLPRVLKRGIKIGEHTDHKSRNKQTVTFAAPVELNGTKGNMAVVVNRHGNHYYAHRILLPDGSVFRFSDKNKETTRESSRGVTVSGSLAKTTSVVPEETIADNQADVKSNYDIRYSLRGKPRATETQEVGSRTLLNTPALDKLGVKVSGSVGRYGMTESLIAKDKAAKSLQKEARKAEKRLKATDAEKEFVNGITAGIYREEEIAARLNKDTVMELAELQAEIDRRSDESYQRKIFDEQGADALAKEINAIKRLQRQAEKIRNPQEKKPIAKSQAAIARKDLAKTLMSQFSIPAGRKVEVGQMIEATAEKIIKEGRISYDDQKALFEKRSPESNDRFRGFGGEAGI